MVPTTSDHDNTSRAFEAEATMRTSLQHQSRCFANLEDVLNSFWPLFITNAWKE